MEDDVAAVLDLVRGFLLEEAGHEGQQNHGLLGHKEER